MSNTMPEVISLVDDSSEEEIYDDSEDSSEDGNDGNASNERTDLVYRAAAALDYDSDEEFCEGDEPPYPHWHYGGERADPLYVEEEDQVYGVIKAFGQIPPTVRVNDKFLELNSGMSYRHDPTFDTNTVTVPMSSLRIIANERARRGRNPSGAANGADLDAESILAVRLALCAGQISNDHQLNKAVHDLVDSYNANSGKKRKFEEYVYDDDEIEARDTMNRTDRARVVGPDRILTNASNGPSSSDAAKDREIAALKAQIKKLEDSERQKQLKTDVYKSRVCSGGCGNDIKHPHILGQFWERQKHDPRSSSSSNNNNNNGFELITIFRLSNISLPSILKTYKNCISATQNVVALGLLDILSRAAENPAVRSKLLYCQAQEITSIDEAFRMILVFAVRWLPKSERLDAKPFFPGAVGPFSQRWRIMDAIADCTFTLLEAKEAIYQFYADLPKDLIDENREALGGQMERLTAILQRRQEGHRHGLE